MRSFRGFCAAFAITACVLSLFIGLFTVGYNSRRMMWGADAATSYRIQDGQLIVKDALGTDTVIAPLNEQRDTTALVPAPIRVGAALWQQLTCAAERLADIIGR